LNCKLDKFRVLTKLILFYCGAWEQAEQVGNFFIFSCRDEARQTKYFLYCLVIRTDENMK